jgi:uncharacterized protein (DUF2236 family)
VARLPAEHAEALTLGPDSVSWRYASDPRVLLTAGYAQLLQLGHPTIASGVRDHSSFERDLYGRLARTLDYLRLLIYGGQDAVEVAARVRAMHRTIKGVNPDGSRYHALEPVAYAWVQATLIKSVVVAADWFIDPISPRERERFYGEWLGLSRLLGVRPGDLPESWAGFETYFGDTVATLEHTDTADVYLRLLRRPAQPGAVPASLAPLWRVARVPMAYPAALASVGLLPPAQRERLGLGWTRSQQAQLRALGAGLRSLTPLLPERVRVTGPGRLRRRADQIARHQFAPRGPEQPARSA